MTPGPIQPAGATPPTAPARPARPLSQRLSDLPARPSVVPADQVRTQAAERAMEAAAVDLEQVEVPDEAVAVETVKEIDRMVQRTGGVGQVGAIGAVVGIAMEGRNIAEALTTRPLKLDAALGALVGIGVHLSEFDGILKTLGVVGGLANVIQGVQGLKESIERLKTEGANPSSVLQTVVSATQTLAGALQAAAVVAAPFFPPAAVALEAASVGLYIACGAASLAQMAYDHRAWIAEKATSTWSAVKSGVAGFFDGDDPAPRTSRAGP